MTNPPKETESPVLLADEKLLWMGRASLRRAVAPTLLLVGPGLLAIASAVVFACQPSATIALRLFGGGVGLALGLLLFMEPLRAFVLGNRLRYFLTTQRVLASEPLYVGTTRGQLSLPLPPGWQLHMKSHDDGTGTIIFFRWDDSSQTRDEFLLVGISDPVAVYQAVNAVAPLPASWRSSSSYAAPSLKRLPFGS